MEVADSEEDEAVHAEEELAPASGFNMEDAKAEFVVVQAVEMTEQQDILESVQDEAYGKDNRQFIRQERTAIVAGAVAADVAHVPGAEHKDVNIHDED
ncbi:Cysteinyl-tRNA synthetase [Hordeum vulgare]|nr:Cysteinyl-tRNA synthetase [Hordeum vulgare]